MGPWRESGLSMCVVLSVFVESAMFNCVLMDVFCAVSLSGTVRFAMSVLLE